MRRVTMNEISRDTPSNAPEFTVSELSQALKRVVEDRFGHVRVRGEISGFKRAASGHLYMALKDESAVLDAVCWRGTAGRLAVAPEDGLEVIAVGRLTTYAGRSKYQIVIESLEIAGEGALLKLLEERRRKLAAEGLFDPARKQPLPYLPDVIGVVTSPTGAVIRDILHRLSDRFPRHVLLWPVLVQGDGAAAQVAAAIEGFNALAPDGPVPRPDLLIVARGGGSLEDLWAFNEEEVVRAAAASTLPIISAVGHETDTTLIDFVADQRAPTPTAAAEMAVPVRSELVATVMDLGGRLFAGATRTLEHRRMRVEGLARGLPDADSLVATKAQYLDMVADRLDQAARSMLQGKQRELSIEAGRLRSPAQVLAANGNQLKMLDERLAAGARRALDRGGDQFIRIDRRLTPEPVLRTLVRLDEKLAQFGERLDSVSYERVLSRGYALVRDRDGHVIETGAAARKAEQVTLQFGADDSVAATVGETSPVEPAAPKRPRKASSRPPPKGEQGTLL